MTPPAAPDAGAPPTGAPTIGVDIGGTKVAAGLVTADGRLLAKTRRGTPPGDTGDGTVAAVVDCIAELRAGDDLVVALGGLRRRLPLPAALRRCTVEGAALRDGELRVRFLPDPDLWRSA